MILERLQIWFDDKSAFRRYLNDVPCNDNSSQIPLKVLLIIRIGNRIGTF